MDTSNVSTSATRVKSKEQLVSEPIPETPTATQLVPVLLRRWERETFFHVPVCHVCHEPIIDFEAANVVVIGLDLSASQKSLGTLDGAELIRLPGTAVVVHFNCDKHEWTPWVRSSSVFCHDQRGPIEKLGWTGVVGS